MPRSSYTNALLPADHLYMASSLPGPVDNTPWLPTSRKQRLYDADHEAIWLFHRQNPTARHEDIARSFDVSRSTISKLLSRLSVDRPVLGFTHVQPSESGSPVAIHRTFESTSPCEFHAENITTAVGGNEPTSEKGQPSVRPPVHFLNSKAKLEESPDGLSQAQLQVVYGPSKTIKGHRGQKRKAPEDSSQDIRPPARRKRRNVHTERSTEDSYSVHRTKQKQPSCAEVAAAYHPGYKPRVRMARNPS
ncbi:hypothetical protein V5O48_003100 [Marasmius crinis-equi]|uniref:Transposase n=1 Tax=Marasmius crinis-equi TaxID=585013 RepID=A0ABR3FUA5_9AGAR